MLKLGCCLKYLSNFWKTLKMPLINRIINLILTWSDTSYIIDNPTANQEPTFTITDTKLYIPVVILSKLLEQLKSSFKRTINWNKYEPKVTLQQRNRYLDFLISPSFNGVNRLFILSLENLVVEQVIRDNIFRL